MTNYMCVSPIHAPYHRLSSLSYFNLDHPQPAGTYYITCNCKVKLKSLLGYTRNVFESQLLRYEHFLRGRSHDTGMTFIPERVHSIPIYFSVSVYMIPRRKLGPAQVIPE